MTILLYGFALVAGALSAVQSGCNGALNKALDQPIIACFVIAGVATATYLAASPFIGVSIPSGERWAQVPWWAWAGGVFGAIYILSTIFVAPAVGAGAYTGLTVTAGVVASVLLDHYGLVGFEVREAGLGRIAGGLLMIGGLVLICLF